MTWALSFLNASLLTAVESLDSASFRQEKGEAAKQQRRGLGKKQNIKNNVNYLEEEEEGERKPGGRCTENNTAAGTDKSSSPSRPGAAPRKPLASPPERRTGVAQSCRVLNTLHLGLVSMQTCPLHPEEPLKGDDGCRGSLSPHAGWGLLIPTFERRRI